MVCGDTIYGTAYQGGANGFGAVYSVNTNGSNFTLLHTFAGSPEEPPFQPAMIQEPAKKPNSRSDT